MGFGVRTGKPSDSGESAAADLEEHEICAPRTSLLAADGGRSSPTQDGRLLARRTAEPGRLEGVPRQSPNKASPNFFNAPSHKRSGFRSPVLESSTICLAMIPSAKLSASPRAARVISSETSRTRLVSASKSPK